KENVSSLLIHVLSRVFMIDNIEETLTKLFRDEQAIDRAINFTSSLVTTSNILGDEPKTTLAAWKSASEYPLKRETTWSADRPQPTASATNAEPQYGKGEPPPELQAWEILKLHDDDKVSHF